MKKLYLVDVSSMFFRAFYAIRQLSNPKGLPTNAVYGVLSMTIKLLRDHRPDYMAFCFDRPEPSFRKEIDPNYKAHRTEMPEDLVPQVPYVRRLAEALGVPCYDRLNYEADDVIGTLAHLGEKMGLEVVIVSGDKDFGQLVNRHIVMYDTMKDIRYDEAGVLEKFGVEPRKMIDYLALIGDSSDNIPGVSGIGPKGAQKLLAEFDSLDDIYKHLDRVSNPGLKKKLDAGKEDAFLSQRLVRIVTDMDLGVKIEDLRLKPIDRAVLSQLLEELDFKSFAKTLLGETSGSVTASSALGAEPERASGATESRDSDSMSSKSSVIENSLPESSGSQNSKIEVIGSNTPGPEGMKSLRLDILGLSKWVEPRQELWGFSTERGIFLARDLEVVEVAGSIEDLGRLLTERENVWRGYNVKDFWKHNQILKGTVSWDHELAAYVIRPGEIEDVHKLFTRYNGRALPELPTPEQLYSAHLELSSHLLRKLKSQGGEQVFNDIELPLVPVLRDMENLGIRIDKEILSEQSQLLKVDLAQVEKEIHQEVGEVFNIASPKQLGQVLFVKLKMPTGKKTKTGFSTDNEVLEKLAEEFPITKKILMYRELAKLKSTYVDSLPLLVNPKTGRVHTTLRQAFTATGRLSSINPNLQNIPIRTERGNAVRKAFVADQGRVLISADYSQIELRILAHIANDQGLIRAFEQDLDIHAATAAEVFDVDLKSVTPEMRRKAKAVNFGLAYGQGAFGLAEVLQISRKEATQIIERYFARFSGVKTYMTDVVETAKKDGYVSTLFGRRRYLDELHSKSPMIRKFGERAAINAPMQGTASDLVKLAMIRLHGLKGADMLLQVHDELIFESTPERAKEIEPTIRKEMEHVAKLQVPLKVNIGEGHSWYDAH